MECKYSEESHKPQHSTPNTPTPTPTMFELPITFELPIDFYIVIWTSRRCAPILWLQNFDILLKNKFYVKWITAHKFEQNKTKDGRRFDSCSLIAIFVLLNFTAAQVVDCAWFLGFFKLFPSLIIKRWEKFLNKIWISK